MNIPSYVDVPMVDMQTGMVSAQWKPILQQLLTTLIDNASDQGLVVPSQDATNVALIQNNVVSNPTGNQFTCQFGTLLYNTTTNQLLVALSNAGVPTFHVVVVI
jgi:hypothetical protein